MIPARARARVDVSRPIAREHLGRSTPFDRRAGGRARARRRRRAFENAHDARGTRAWILARARAREGCSAPIARARRAVYFRSSFERARGVDGDDAAPGPGAVREGHPGVVDAVEGKNSTKALKGR